MGGVTIVSPFKYRGYTIQSYYKGGIYFVKLQKNKHSKAITMWADTPIKARLLAERTINEWTRTNS